MRMVYIYRCEGLIRYVACFSSLRVWNMKIGGLALDKENEVNQADVLWHAHKIYALPIQETNERQRNQKMTKRTYPLLGVVEDLNP